MLIRERPLYWSAVFLLGGMVFSKLLLDREWWFAGSLAIYILLGLTRFGLFPPKSKFWLLACFVIGSSYYCIYDLTNRTELSLGEATLKGDIVSGIDSKDEEVKFELQVKDINGKEVNEKVLCRFYLRNASDKRLTETLKPGDKLLLHANLVEPEMPRNPGGLDYRQLLYFKRIHWIAQPVDLTSMKVIPAPYFSLSASLYSWQMYLSHVTQDTFPEELASLMKGLLLGIRSDLDPDMSDIYKQLGLAHVLAISGLHMAVLSTSILTLISMVGISKEKALIITCIILPIYILIAGASPSIVRSGLMSMIILIGMYLKRPTDTFNIWGAVLLCMLCWDPYQLWDVGFQLSFGCVWGLIYLCPELPNFLPPPLGRFSPYISIGFAAQLCSFPFSIFYFHHYFLLSLFVNLVFVPLYSLLFIPIGFLALGLGMLHPGLAFLTVKLLNIIYHWMSISLIHVSNLTWADWFITEPSYWWLAVYYIVLVHGLWIMKKRVFFWIGLLTAVIIVSIFPIKFNSDKVTITFLDVGQGDAIVIETKTHTTLIDAGGVSSVLKQLKATQHVYNAGRGVVIPYLQWKGINHLDYVVATHGDLDHIGGMQSVLRKITVKNFLRNGKTPTTTEEKEMLGFLAEHHIPIYSVQRGWSWADEENVKWTVFNPTDALRMDSDNNNSIVLLLEAYGSRILFTGDLEKVGEHELLNSQQPTVPSVDVLKVGHHGSRTSTTEEWMGRLRPAISILSVGRNNRYGHPHQETLQTIERSGSRIYRTDQQGAITIEIKKDGLNVSPFCNKKAN